MLKSIKSSYFNKILFSYIDEIKKLKLLKHNKTLQKYFNISIINYKNLSEKYIIYESKVFAREYDRIDDKLIYEGEYLNGERHGKGKVYYIDSTIYFEGEYLYGKKNGKGKVYHTNGVIWFEVEYKNGLKNGKGKEYHYNGKLSFEGEYVNGREWIGTQYDENGNVIYKINNDINGIGKGYNDSDCTLKFEGEYLNGKRNGKGKEYDSNGKIRFEGEYLNNQKWIGTRYDKDDKVLYKLNNNINWEGKEYYLDGKIKFEGEYLNGQRRKEKNMINIIN